MSNINDYLEWRGDIPFEFSGFNEVDNIILARFSYLPFRKIKMEEEETIRNIAKKMVRFQEEDFAYHGDREMIALLGRSERFKDFKVTDFQENNDAESEKQFAAITIHLPNDEIYISFDGTDNSIVGWKEDFNMSFLENVPSQIEGAEYAKKIADKYPNTKIYMGGHSKGGNIAVYAAIESSKGVQKRIKKVINCDGPGFDISIVESMKYKNIIQKVFTYIPQDSVIGRVLEHEEDYEVVKSVEKGLYQHDIFSWQVLGTKIITVDKVTNNSEFINKTIREYLKNTTPEQRELFVQTVYDIIQSTDVTTFKEFSSVWIKKIPTIIKTYKRLSDEDKKVMTSMIGEFFKSGSKVFKDRNKYD